ncbi:MAG: alpha-amylase family glycosyl hydrolase, partial [Rhodobacterales bacterium]
MSDTQARPWWHTGTIYQIYPRSFMDSNGDGIGDLAGIESKLDYLCELGIKALWISPFSPSPMKDFGYDVADYCDVDPIFGDLNAFARLADAAHARGLKILMDFVPSHTSDQHAWFRDSRSTTMSEKRDWYVWRDPKPDGSPPNNWISEFAGPAWTLDPTTGQYYLHIFLTEQPALNWHNPEVRAAMYDVMRFWFDRGVDGFRIDAFENLAPEPDRGDNLPNLEWDPKTGPARSLHGTYSKHQPQAYDVALDMRRVAEEYSPSRLLIGEIYGSIDQVMGYYGTHHDGFQLPFNFQLIEAPWTAPALAAIIAEYESKLPEGAWPNWVLGNHDRSRIASRVGAAQARNAAMLLLTLRGTPTIYQGDELGMENVTIPPDQVKDPWEVNVPGQGLGRDPVRTPLAWETGENGGFTTGTPWLPMDLSPGISVAEQTGDAASMLELHRLLLAQHVAHPALTLGDLVDVTATGPVLSYARVHGDTRLDIALNLSDAPQPMPFGGTCLISTRPAGPGAPDTLAPNEG